MSNYKVVRRIGSGTFGKVYLLQEGRAPGREFALKMVDLGHLSNKEEKCVSEEGLLMLKLCHNHLVHCWDAFVCNHHLFLVLELCNHGSLDNFLCGRNSLVPEGQICLWFSQMADVLRYLHALKVIHRDLKPANLFLDHDHDIKLGDLGVARQLDHTLQERQTVAGTLSYMSPELFTATPYSYKTDIWSLGCCIHEAMTLNKTFQSQSWVELHHLITSVKVPKISSFYHKDLRHLVMSLFNPDPYHRPDALEIMHSLFQIHGRQNLSTSYSPPVDIKFDQREIVQAVKTFEMAIGHDGIVPLKANGNDSFQSTMSSDSSSLHYTEDFTDSITSSPDQTIVKDTSRGKNKETSVQSQHPMAATKLKKKNKVLKPHRKRSSPRDMETERFVEDLTRGCRSWLQNRGKQNTDSEKDVVNDVDDCDEAEDEDDVPSGLVTLFTQAQTAVYINQRDSTKDSSTNVKS